MSDDIVYHEETDPGWDEFLRETEERVRDILTSHGEEHDPKLVWVATVTARGCQIHDDHNDCEGPVQGCHIISKQSLKRHGFADRLWDVRNGIGACRKAHTRSDSGLERFPRDKIPNGAFFFAGELGLGYLFDKLYPIQEQEKAA